MEQQSRYIVTMQFALPEGITWDDAFAATSDVLDCASDKGLIRMGGGLHRAREDRPIEEFHWGSEEGHVYRNGLALHGATSQLPGS